MFLQNLSGLLVFVFHLSCCNAAASSLLCHPLQSQALLLLKSNFLISKYDFYCVESYPKTESWKEDTDCCSSWDGVKCDEVSGRVIELDLSCSLLAGTIDSNHTLFSSHIAPYLQRLNLAGNYLFGHNISSLFGSSLTHLNLSYFDFNARNIPSEIFLLSNLISLDLSNCHVRGNIPSNISHLSNLVTLDLSNSYDLTFQSNRVFETIALNLVHLRVLNLDGVGMSSLHASFLTNLSSSLASLSLVACRLQGQLPTSFLLRPNLQGLDLSTNQISPINSLPDITPSSSNLLLLDLSHTNFSLSSSSSTDFLDFVGDRLKSLRYLDLNDCNINGSIPPSLGNLTQLTYLDLQDNHLTGPIPTSLGNLTKLTHLDLVDNNLNGPIPTSFSNLILLDSLYLNDNELEGPLPCYLFALPSLYTVDLSYNKLHGQIPTSPVKSVNLAHLSLANNNLSGPLDFDVFLSLTKLVNLDLSNNNISSSSTSASASANTNLTYSLPSFYSLDLSGCNLNQFPTFMKALTNLRSLDVSNNKIQGSLPHWIYNVGKHTMFSVDLSDNFLTSVGHQVRWKNIRSIDFRSNLLQGPLPIPSKTTTFFSVSKNLLSGEISSLICNISDLQVFDLSDNQFNGSIPQCLGSLWRLSVLNLGVNELHGVIPNTFQKENSLNYLVLNGNKLRGPLPRSLSHCQSLQIMDVGNNMIQDTIPRWLEALSKLEVLVLRSNKFFGSLNNFKAKLLFPNLRILDISINNFTGKLPHKLIKNLNAIMNVDEKLKGGSRYMERRVHDSTGRYYSMVITVKGLETKYEKILTTFATIDLSRNKFEGYIPEIIEKLVSLRGLNLSHNILTGHIPSSMRGLVSLEWLDLSSNELTGQIPRELADMTFLAVLNLSHNRLDGPIPQGRQFNTFGNDSYRNNLALCGYPLSKACGSSNEPALENKDFSNSKIEFSWEGVVIGFGCGIVYGMYMGYLLCKRGTLKWLERKVEGKMRQERAGKRSKRHKRGGN